jgi:hypothetical protein
MITVCHTQSLTPRAYVTASDHSNAVILTYSFCDGGVLFDGALPTTGAKSATSRHLLC